jgi:hypothetical protein
MKVLAALEALESFRERNGFIWYHFFLSDVLKHSSRDQLCSQRWPCPTNYYVWGSLATVLLVIIIVTLAVVVSVPQYERILASKIRSIFVWGTV